MLFEHIMVISNSCLQTSFCFEGEASLLRSLMLGAGSDWISYEGNPAFVLIVFLDIILICPFMQQLFCFGDLLLTNLIRIDAFQRIAGIGLYVEYICVVHLQFI